MTTPSTTVELASEPFAKVPHVLILSCPAPVVRMYGMLHYLGWNHIPFEVADLMRLLGTDDKPINARSVYRWLDALAADGWIAYDRKPGKRGLGARISLYTSPFGQGQTSDSDVRGSPQPLTLRSEDRQTSDSDVRGSPQPLTLRSEDRQTSDRRVRGSHETPHQDAPGKGTQIRTQIPDSDPESPSPIPILDGASTGMDGWPHAVENNSVSASSVPDPATETASLLRAIGVHPSTIPKLAHLPPAQVALVIDAARKKPDLIDLASWVVSILKKVSRPGAADAHTLDRALAAIAKEPANGAHSARRSRSRPPTPPSHPAPAGSPRAPKPHELEERFRQLEASRRPPAGDAAD